ncbi:MAG: hypothetical protein JWQ90_1236 [Hydrocarboniphaga sp.]|uniref:hypothetical protein n=1 Tax=Hydrocarboniphaga sp. TaxID=2033016 RepID=UPI002603FEF1|nr:hypothetical protein [Hydrocarboniphaga sp.]MDB5968786.1 hypothetical protein [Hydrocarboniphaga sp.]
MKKLAVCTSLALLLALPTISYARDHHGDRGDRDDRGGYHDRGYRDDRDRYEHRGYYDHGRWRAAAPIRFVGAVIALPFEVGAAVIGAAVNVVAAPFYPRNYYAQPEQASYGPPQGYYERDERRQYEPPVGRVYDAPPEYYPPQPEYRGY